MLLSRPLGPLGGFVLFIVSICGPLAGRGARAQTPKCVEATLSGKKGGSRCSATACDTAVPHIQIYFTNVCVLCML